MLKQNLRVEKTRSAIQHAFIKLMRGKDYKKITVQEIAQEAQINRVTFYLHYFDKEDLLEQTIDEMLVNLRNRIIIPEEEYQFQIDEPVPTFVRMCRHIIENAKLYKMVLLDGRLPEVKRQLQQLIKDSVKDSVKFYRSKGTEFSVPEEVVIAYITSAYIGVIIWWLENDMPYSPTYLSAVLTQLAAVGPYVSNPFSYKINTP